MSWISSCGIGAAMLAAVASLGSAPVRAADVQDVPAQFADAASV